MFDYADYIKHDNFTDVVFKVISCTIGHEIITIYGDWINVVHRPINIGFDIITIKKKHLKHWKCVKI